MDVRGVQRPRLEWIPPAGALSDAGLKAADLAARADLILDDWQRYVVDQALRRRPDGRWSAFEVALIVSRQNGKGTVLEALELAGLFLGEQDGFGDERLILHSAHEFKTASEAFRRILALIQDCRLLSRQVKQVYLQRGAESIELKNGKRLRFVARSSGSGRGFSGDRVILDEAQILGNEAMEAVLPTLSARPNPQVVYTATAGNQDSVQLGRLRQRGLAGGDASLAFMEWSAEETDDPADPVTWAKANPGLGIRITPDYVSRERATLSPEGFARERLSVGDYPVAGAALSELGNWELCADPGSAVMDPVALGFSVAPDRSWSAIAVGGRRGDGLGHGELVAHERGTAWLMPRLLELHDAHEPCVLVMNPVGAAGAFEKELAERKFSAKPGPGERLLQLVGAREYAQACGALAADVADGRWRHLGQAPLDNAVASARTRELTDAWAWSWKLSEADISPLEAVTLARHGFMTFGVVSPPVPNIF